MDDLLIVMSNPRDNRDAEFNDWYGNIHIRDVMRLPGSSAVQRFRLAEHCVAATPGIVPDRAFAYLALYECHDIELVTEGHAAVFSPAMRISDSFDFAMREGYYRPVVHRQTPDCDRYAGDVIIERIGADAGRDMLEWYDRERMPALMALPGVIAGTLTCAADHQMLPVADDAKYIAVYRTTDIAATFERWGTAPALGSGNEAQVAGYRPLMARLSARDVVHAPAASRAAEARARIALGENFYREFPEGIALD